MIRKLDEEEFARAHFRAEKHLGRPLSLAENREIRRSLLPPGVNIQATACLFVGRDKPTGVFQRLAAYGDRVRDHNIVVLTEHALSLVA